MTFIKNYRKERKMTVGIMRKRESIAALACFAFALGALDLRAEVKLPT